MKSLHRSALSVALFLCATATPLAEPLYSSIKPEDCVLYARTPLGAGTACQGLGGYSLAIEDVDLRIYLTILRPEWDEAARIDLKKITGGSFSSLPSGVAEWRGSKVEPTALILRLGYQEGDNRPGQQALAVIRLDKRAASRTCLIGWIPRRPEMNAKARALAVSAADKPCR